jgi:predicted nucleic acid-binding protein
MTRRTRAACVVDASAVLAVLFREPDFADVLEALPARGMIAPPLLSLEVANVARGKVQRRELSRADAEALLVTLDRWRIQRVDVAPRDAWDLAWAHDLTVYDAAYLHLSIAHRIPIVTLDAELRRAAGPRARP